MTIIIVIFYTNDNNDYNHTLVPHSDLPKFGSVPAKIRTWTEIPVPFPARFKVPVSAEISVKKWTKIWLKVNWNL